MNSAEPIKKTRDLENIKNYEGLGRVYTALEFLSKTDFNSMDLGRYELDGDNIFYMVQ